MRNHSSRSRLLPRLHSPPSLDNDILGPNDLIPRLYDRRALSGDIPGHAPSICVTPGEDLSPGSLHHRRRPGAFGCGEKSGAEEGEGSDGEFAVEDM